MSIAVWGWVDFITFPCNFRADCESVSRPQVSLYWMLYESLKSRFIPGYTPSSSRTPSQSISGLSEESLTLRYLMTSSTACGISVTLTNPIDAVQARWQTSAGKAGGLRDIVKTMWKIGGTSAFLRGIGARIAYTVSLEPICVQFLTRVNEVDPGQRYFNDHIRIGKAKVPAKFVIDANTQSFQRENTIQLRKKEAPLQVSPIP